MLAASSASDALVHRDALDILLQVFPHRDGGAAPRADLAGELCIDFYIAYYIWVFLKDKVGINFSLNVNEQV